MLDRQWRTGLDGPKGLALHDGKLYVSDITRLVVIDTANGEIIATYDAPGAKFLNDVTAHEDGRVFVSDMTTNQIWQLEGDQFSVWLEDGALQNPNGLLAEPDRLLVASWGSTEVPGHLKAVDYQSKSIETVGEDQPKGHLDGLEPDGKGGYLVTDWLNGGLYKFDEHGPAALLMDLDGGGADLEFVIAENLAVIPKMMDGTVVAYNIP